MKITINPERSRWPSLLERPLFDVSGLHQKVQEILTTVKKSGDRALREYTLKFDGIAPEEIRVSPEEIALAEEKLDASLKSAMHLAALNIETFHAQQKPELMEITTAPGVTCWQKALPIEKVGLYIPGGSAPLFSSVLMLGIPARIAGCNEIVLCTPPQKDATIHPAILYAAKLAGTETIFRAGGAQAIGAMAYGTETIPRVDKIFGPGNQYVNAAKQLVSMNDVAIDLPAGPSEVMIVADESSNPAFIAADLLSQAEHGPDSQVVLIGNTEALVREVKKQIGFQLEELPRRELAEKSLEHSRMIVMEDEQKTIDMVNAYAPEHLILSTENCHQLAEKVISAGSVFLGNYAPESAGDYASGTNHTLPTNGWARAYSGVTTGSFMKKITFQELTREGMQSIGPAIETMAEAEQLQAHKNAVTIRLKEINSKIK